MTWGMIGGAVISVVGGSLLGGGGGGGGGGGASSQQQQIYDPYGPYRGAAAQQLNALMADPSSATNSSYGQAMQLGAARTMAAQGYTGSGNALVAAANASGQAYQQQFNNLALLSGAGQSPAAAMGAANAQSNYQQGQNNNMWGQIGSLAGHFLGGGGSSGGGWNGVYGSSGYSFPGAGYGGVT